MDDWIVLEFLFDFLEIFRIENLSLEVFLLLIKIHSTWKFVISRLWTRISMRLLKLMKSKYRRASKISFSLIFIRNIRLEKKNCENVHLLISHFQHIRAEIDSGKIKINNWNVSIVFLSLNKWKMRKGVIREILKTLYLTLPPLNLNGCEVYFKDLSITHLS